MLPEYYEFQHSTKLIAGTNALESIPAELLSLGAKRPMVLSDAVLKKIGTLKVVCDAIAGEGTITIGAIYSDIPADSSSDVVNEIASLFRSSGCDSIVAVGGGSVLDTAKGVRMLLSGKEADIMELLGCEILTAGRRIPFAAVPTTSGTGSESTLVAVIRNAVTGTKMEFISYFLQPDVAVLDPRMTMTLPASLTASTGMDALCHAIEACTCLQKNPVSDAYGTGAIRLIVEYLEEAVKNGKNKEARLAMASASAMAGGAFSNSMVGVVHAIGHALGGICRVPHAEAMTILLPYCMRFNMDQLGEEYGKLLLPFAGPETYLAVSEEQRGMKFAQEIMDLELRLHELCGLPLTLKEKNVDPAQFSAVAAAAMNDGAMIVNPKQVTQEDIIQILQEAYEGKWE